MKNIVTYIALALLALVSVFLATAFAAGGTLPEDMNIWDLLRPVYEAFKNGNHVLAGMTAIVAAVALAKRYMPGKAGAWINGKYGQPLSVLAMTFAASMATAISAGGLPSFGMAKTAALIAAAAAGGYSMIKTLIVEPFLRPWAAKAPTWIRWAFDMILWIFDRPMPVAKAEAAGAAAVAAKPGTGIEAVTGKAREVE